MFTPNEEKIMDAFATVYGMVKDSIDVFNNHYFKIDLVGYYDSEGRDVDYTEAEAKKALKLIECVLLEWMGEDSEEVA